MEENKADKSNSSPKKNLFKKTSEDDELVGFKVLVLSIQKIVFQIIDHPIFIGFMLCITIWALLGDDIRQIVVNVVCTQINIQL